MELIIKETGEEVTLKFYYNGEDKTVDSGFDELVLDYCSWDGNREKFVISQETYDEHSRIIKARVEAYDGCDKLERDLRNKFGSEETEKIIQKHIGDLDSEFGEEYTILEAIEKMRKRYLCP